MADKWMFIVNSTAGNGKSGKKINSLVEHLGKLALQYSIELTKSTHHATEIAKDACLHGYKNIFAVGGDGTASEVAAGIARSGFSEHVNFGIIPAGGGNDFSRNFLLSSNVDKCLDQAVNGKIIKIDLALFNDHFFLNSFGIGFDAQVAQIANNIKFLNGLPRYLAAIALAMLKFKNFPLKIIIDDDQTITGKFLLLAVSNGKFAGGGFKINPEANTFDNYLDLMLADNVTFLRVFSVLPKAVKGLHEFEREISFHRCQKIEVFSDFDLPVYFDGEIPQLNNSRYLKIELAPQKLNFIVPA
jgi:diacylglycerol kinase (ATP)